MNTLDARGLACPGPVLLAKKTIDDQRPERLAMLVDNDAARENVGRFLGSRGFAVSVERQGDDYLLSGVLQGGGGGEVAAESPATSAAAQAQPAAAQPRVVVLIGSDFEIRVWQTLLKIPMGRAVSYSDIAGHLGAAKAARAVGAAVGRNPISFVVPCHRALGKGGALTGYHWGLTRKQAMLGWEAGHSQ